MKRNGMSLTQRMVRTMLIGIIALLATTALSAQDVTVASAKTFYKPGDTIRLSIMFDGPDAEEINVLNLGSDG